VAPTQTKIYRGTPEEQLAAFLVDSAEAAQHGWEPRSFEHEPGSMHVIYGRRELDAQIPATAGTDVAEPAAGQATVSRLRSRDIWEPIVYGVLLALLIMAIWAVFVYRPALDGKGPTQTPQRATVARCSPAVAGLVEAIEAGLKVEGGGGLRDGYTITSRDHADMYFVAARISGIGMAGAVGLWATSDLGGNGPLYSVNSTAKRFSVWDYGAATAPRLSQLDDGAEVVVACADG
jgi:hypothetical protein